MAQVSKSWPRCVLVNPSPISAETFACRFRDAVRGITEFGSGTEDQLTSIFPWALSYTISIKHGQCLIGLSTEIKKVLSQQSSPTTYGTVIAGEVSPTHDTFDSPDNTVLAAICLLLELNFLSHATISNTTEAQVRQHLKGLRPLEIVDQNGTLTIF